MNVLILGAGGFLGSNLANQFADTDNNLILVNKSFDNKYISKYSNANVKCICENIDINTDFNSLTKNIDIVYHLLSSTVPSNSTELLLNEDIFLTIKLLNGMINNHCKRIVFISSGGTVYGNAKNPPFKEETYTNPITPYGIQKLTIEKYLYFYHYDFGLDYRIIRLPNPYGKNQVEKHGQGLIPTILHKALNDEELIVYGDGNNIRDYIYIDDVIDGIMKISMNNTLYKLYNLGTGIGTSINRIIDIMRQYYPNLKVRYVESRKSDVRVNYLDVNRFCSEFNVDKFVSIEEGILKTITYWKNN